jgi:hypothetical protein
MNSSYIFLMLFFIIIFFRFISIAEKGKVSLENFDYGLLTKESRLINNKQIIFTVTTFFDFKKEDKWEVFCNGMDSIFKFHPDIESFIDFYVINEYSDNPREDWEQKLKERYPFMKLIQKPIELKGQGKSLNLILDMIKTYTYWIHWEEAWFATRSFLYESIQIMNVTQITQLQFTQEQNHTHWQEKIVVNDCYLVPNKYPYCIIKYDIDDYPLPDLDKEFTHDDWMNVKWPLYSIRPSINRVSDYTFGKFSENSNYWPLKFEMEFGNRWMKRNNVKAIFTEGPVTRKKTHISSYH